MKKKQNAQNLDEFCKQHQTRWMNGKRTAATMVLVMHSTFRRIYHRIVSLWVCRIRFFVKFLGLWNVRQKMMGENIEKLDEREREREWKRKKGKMINILILKVSEFQYQNFFRNCLNERIDLKSSFPYINRMHKRHSNVLL